MPKPWEITREEAAAAGERMRAAREAVDREDASLLAHQLAEREEVIKVKSGRRGIRRSNIPRRKRGT